MKNQNGSAKWSISGNMASANYSWDIIELKLEAEYLEQTRSKK